MAELWYRLVTPRKRHCLAKLTLYVHICYVCDGLYASWRVKATLRYRFKTLDRKPRPRSQSYIGPTTVGPDKSTNVSNSLFPYFLLKIFYFLYLASIFGQMRVRGTTSRIRNNIQGLHSGFTKERNAFTSL